jgi:heme/copper-type cytochrome/quinol oxidase subunit 2
MSESILTGAFGVVVALITWLLAGFRQRDTFRRDMKIEHLRKLESLYAAEIEALEMSIRVTISLVSYEHVERELSKNNALLRLLSTKQIIDQLENVAVTMLKWSTLYRKGEPKPIGDTGISIIKSGDSDFTQRAQELRPRLNDEIVVLVELMASHLAHERKSA